MKISLLAFVLTLSAYADADREIRCKADFVPAERIVSYTNLELDRRGESNFEEDCAQIFIDFLRTDKLPEVLGERMPAHLVYELPEDDLFLMIDRFLAASQGGKLRMEIRFSFPTEMKSDVPMTEMTVDLVDRPAL